MTPDDPLTTHSRLAPRSIMQTLIIPAGWIYAAYTPQSTLVVGGTFVDCLHVESQVTAYRHLVKAGVVSGHSRSPPEMASAMASAAAAAGVEISHYPRHPGQVDHDRSFEAMIPLMWLLAGHLLPALQAHDAATDDEADGDKDKDGAEVSVVSSSSRPRSLSNVSAASSSSGIWFGEGSEDGGAVADHHARLLDVAAMTDEEMSGVAAVTHTLRALLRREAEAEAAACAADRASDGQGALPKRSWTWAAEAAAKMAAVATPSDLVTELEDFAGATPSDFDRHPKPPPPSAFPPSFAPLSSSHDASHGSLPDHDRQHPAHIGLDDAATSAPWLNLGPHNTYQPAIGEKGYAEKGYAEKGYAEKGYAEKGYGTSTEGMGMGMGLGLDFEGHHTGGQGGTFGKGGKGGKSVMNHPDNPRLYESHRSTSPFPSVAMQPPPLVDHHGGDHHPAMSTAMSSSHVDDGELDPFAFADFDNAFGLGTVEATGTAPSSQG